MTLPAISEKQFQQQVTDLAEALGWTWAHFRPAQTARGWRTPVSGPLGAGWPDLVLCRPGRTLFVELKAEGKKASQKQIDVMLSIAAAGNTVMVWRPSQWSGIVACLQRRSGSNGD